MELTSKCSPGLKDIDETIRLYKNQKLSVIKSIILSGECDDQLLELALKYPPAPILFFSEEETCMRQGYDQFEYSISSSAIEFLKEFVDRPNVDVDLAYGIEDSPWEIQDNTYIRLMSQDKYTICLFSEEMESLDDYNYEICYYSNSDVAFLVDYWKSLLLKNRDAYGAKLIGFLTPSYEDGEETVNLDEL